MESTYDMTRQEEFAEILEPYVTDMLPLIEWASTDISWLIGVLDEELQARHVAQYDNELVLIAKEAQQRLTAEFWDEYREFARSTYEPGIDESE